MAFPLENPLLSKKEVENNEEINECILEIKNRTPFPELIQYGGKRVPTPCNFKWGNGDKCVLNDNENKYYFCLKKYSLLFIIEVNDTYSKLGWAGDNNMIIWKNENINFSQEIMKLSIEKFFDEIESITSDD